MSQMLKISPVCILIWDSSKKTGRFSFSLTYKVLEEKIKETEQFYLNPALQGLPLSKLACKQARTSLMVTKTDNINNMLLFKALFAVTYCETEMVLWRPLST